MFSDEQTLIPSYSTAEKMLLVNVFYIYHSGIVTPASKIQNENTQDLIKIWFINCYKAIL